MQTNQTTENASKNPALISDEVVSNSLLVNLHQFLDDVPEDGDFLEHVIEVAKDAGCQFLFEVPGSLFEEPDYRAAAVIQDLDDEETQTIFILCSQEAGTIQLLHEVEVEPEVLGFVESYANVLLSLNKLETCHQLH